MKSELLTEILKFRLYSNYNAKSTLSENSNVIQEQFVAELKKLITNPNIRSNIKKTVTNLMKQGEDFIDEIDLFGSKKTADDVLDSVDTLSKESLRKLKVGVINKGDAIAATQIDNMIKDPGFINKYTDLTLADTKKELLSNGYNETAINQILSKFTKNGNKFKSSADEIAQQSMKTLNAEISQLKSIVSEFESKSVKEILKNPALKEYVKGAKTLLNTINDKNLENLPVLTQTQIAALGAMIKAKNPGLWLKITTKLSEHKKKLGAVIVLIMLYLFGAENTGYFTSQFVGEGWDSLKSFFVGAKKGIDARSTTQGAETYQGIDDNGKPIFK